MIKLGGELILGRQWDPQDFVGGGGDLEGKEDTVIIPGRQGLAGARAGQCPVGLDQDQYSVC